MIIAILWLKSRLDKTEAKMDARELERDQDRKVLITVLETTKMTLETNSRVLDETNKTILHCKVVRHSQDANQ